MRLEPPENVDGLSPREAWQAGVRAGQEGLAKSITSSARGLSPLGDRGIAVPFRS
jgi:hypothetical protein